MTHLPCVNDLNGRARWGARQSWRVAVAQAEREYEAAKRRWQADLDRWQADRMRITAGLMGIAPGEVTTTDI